MVPLQRRGIISRGSRFFSFCFGVQPLHMNRFTEHRIRAAAGLARPGWTWAAAVAMNAPTVAACVVVGWFAFTADAPELAALAGVIFVMALCWAGLASLESWRVLRRFTRRCRAPTRSPRASRPGPS